MYESKGILQYLCINSNLIHGLGSQAWVINDRSDTAEEIVWLSGNDSTICGFRPYKNRFKPIWPLEGKKNVYGIGTYFADPETNLPIAYHHFYSRIFIARLDFFFVSFFYYIRLKYIDGFYSPSRMLASLKKFPRNFYRFLVNFVTYFFTSNL